MNSIQELDPVALTTDVLDHRLKYGDLGTVVLVHGQGDAFEVEFVRFDGQTLALLTLSSSQVRTLSATDIPHVRESVQV